MSELLGMDNWDLQSVVRGTCFNDYFSTSANMAAMDDPTLVLPCFSPLFAQENIDQLIFNSFPDQYDQMIEPTAIFDELDQLYKPFYPISVSSDHDQHHQLEKVQEKQLPIASSPIINIIPPTTTAHVAKYKKSRKTQHKRVVLKVTAEGLSSDLWAWRKYGQKPIKGSPFPRSYYRCSSSKGCLARKQVEQSCSEPGMFIITYTAEHNHSQPTRRNSLAGTTRHRFSSSKSPTSSSSTTTTTTAHSDHMPTPKHSPSALSPTTPLSTIIENEFSPPAIKKESSEEKNHDEHMVEDMIFNNDFFVGLDGLDGYDFV